MSIGNAYYDPVSFTTTPINTSVETPTTANSFKDNTGREWAVNLAIGDVTRIKKETGIDLWHALRDGEGLVALFHADPEKRGRLLFIAADADAAGVTEGDFYHAISG